jgi:archaetidylinositol phosphate synthase
VRDTVVGTISPAIDKTRDHVREHRSILADGEKRVLVWIAGRLPSWVSPDHLTLVGLTAMIAAGLGFALADRGPASLFLVVGALALNWFGDSLDGTLARVRNQLRPRYGFYVDHVVDIVGTSALLIGLACSGLMSPLTGASVLAAYLVVSAESYLATHTVGVFRISFLGIGPTELRILLATGALYALHKPRVTLHELGTFLLFDVGGTIAIAGLALTFVVSATRNTRALYQAEPRPAREQPLQ